MKNLSLFLLQMNVELNWLRIIIDLLILLISVSYLYWAFFVIGPDIGLKGLHPLVLTLWGGLNIGGFLSLIKFGFELFVVTIRVIKIYFRCQPK